MAFYDALGTNDSAVQAPGDEKLHIIVCVLVENVRKIVTIYWTLRENVQARLRVIVKRILRHHGSPPDKQEKATQTVLKAGSLALHRIGSGKLKSGKAPLTPRTARTQSLPVLNIEDSGSLRLSWKRRIASYRHLRPLKPGLLNYV